MATTINASDTEQHPKSIYFSYFFHANSCISDSSLCVAEKGGRQVSELRYPTSDPSSAPQRLSEAEAWGQEPCGGVVRCHSRSLLPARALRRLHQAIPKAFRAFHPRNLFVGSVRGYHCTFWGTLYTLYGAVLFGGNYGQQSGMSGMKQPALDGACQELYVLGVLVVSDQLPVVPVQLLMGVSRFPRNYSGASVMSYVATILGQGIDDIKGYHPQAAIPPCLGGHSTES
eukprot:scaffold246216_cov52-Prasinocladus_malaysianus.AAC.2